MIKRPLHMSHDFLAEVLDPSAVALDATMGNGHDTLFLAKLAQRVYAFDIQQQALQQTQKRLEEAGCENVHLILDGHQNLDKYVTSPLRAAIFNLGYLPSEDKTVITSPETTLEALEKILERLESGGRVALMVYYGHKGGEAEKNQVLDFASSLPQNLYTVMVYQPINQVHKPPFLIMIEKVKAEK